MGKLEKNDFPDYWELYGPREKEDIVREYKNLSGDEFSFEGFHHFFQKTYACNKHNQSDFQTK